MKRPSIKKTAIALLAFVFSIGSASVAVVYMPTWTSNAGVVSNSGSVSVSATNTTYYLSGQMEFTTASTSIGDFAFIDIIGGADSTRSTRHLIGITGDTFNFIDRSFDPDRTNHALSGLGSAIEDGDIVDFVLKVDQVDRNMKFWLDPDRTQLEDDQTSATITTDLTPYNYSSVSEIIFVAGNVGTTGVTTFSNFAFFTDSDTPFLTVPEPETYALIFGGLALGFVMLRRRIKG